MRLSSYLRTARSKGELKKRLTEAKAKLTPQGWIVLGSLDLSDLGLTRLPKLAQVGETLSCGFNQLTNLEGCPKTLEGDFYCPNNQLTSLKGAPTVVGGYFNCSHNLLVNLLGAPKSVGKDFILIGNKLTSLKGAPKKVGGRFDVRQNPERFVEDDVRAVSKAGHILVDLGRTPE